VVKAKPAVRVAKPAVRVAKPAKATAPGVKLTSARRLMLFACMLISHKNYNTFNVVKKRVVVKGRVIGQFEAGFQTIFYDLHLVDCMARLSGIKRVRYDDVTPVKKFTGLPVYNAKAQKKVGYKAMNNLNPDLIRWSKANLIPEPTDSVLGLRFEKLYKVVGQSFFRITALTYEYLRRNPKLNQRLYNLNKTTVFSNVIKVRKALRSLLNSPITGRAFKGDYDYHAGHAGTFWMRRQMDGTKALVWDFFKAVLQKYDPAFLAMLPKVSFAKALPKVVILTADKSATLPAVLKSLPNGSRVILKAGRYQFNKGLVLENKKNITLEGQGEAWILVKDAYANVLTIRGSSNITIKGLKMRHNIIFKNYQCEGAVISVIRSHKIWVRNNTLNGSGAIGVRGYRSSNLVVTHNFLHTNSMTAIMLDRSAWIAIHNNTIVSNGSTLYLWRTHGLRMSRNAISHNNGHTPLSTPFMRKVLGK
jgi:hypothetical protein